MLDQHAFFYHMQENIYISLELRISAYIYSLCGMYCLNFKVHNPDAISFHTCSPVIWLFAVLFLLSNTHGKASFHFSFRNGRQ